jgi:pSer/pThr/pTyr-binding forkhead associated (FHA) protein
MAGLKNVQSGRVFELSVETLVGRRPDCDLVIDSSRVSKEHALLRWTGDGISVRDKGSANGTWLEDERLPAGEDRRLELGKTLYFGSRQEAWACIDVAAPEGALPLVTDRFRFGLDEVSLRVGPPNSIALVAAGQPHHVSLSPGEYDVVRALAEQRSKDREQGVHREGWVLRKDFGDSVCGSVPTLNQHVKRLRDKVRRLDLLSSNPADIIEQVEREIRIGVAHLVID